MLLLLFACSQFTAARASTQVDRQGKTVTIGSYRYDAYNRELALTPLSELVSELAAREVRIVLYDSPTDLTNAISRNEVDVAVVNLTGFLQLMPLDKALMPVATPKVDARKAREYRSVVLRLKNESTQPSKEENAKVVALVWPDSSSGGIVPMSFLSRNAIGAESQKTDYSIIYSGSHEASLDALLSGKADLAGMAKGVLLQRAKRDVGVLDDVDILWESQPIPVPPILCFHSNELDCSIFRNSLLSNEIRAAKVAKALSQGWPEFGALTQFIQPEQERYTDLKFAYDQLKEAPKVDREQPAR